MRLFKAIAYDISRNPDLWTYDEHSLVRSLRGSPVQGAIKITFFCNMPYVVLIGRVSQRAGLFDRIRLRSAGQKWLKFHFAGIEKALFESLPIDKWMEQREIELAARKST